MARRVFFSFHYERDNWKISQIRNSRIAKGYEQPPFMDHAKWEAVKRSGDAAIKRWIDSQLKGASVTVVLIGAETYSRKWVQYEIQESHRLGKGLLGIRLQGMKERTGQIDTVRGRNPFKSCNLPITGFLGIQGQADPPIYSWVDDNGRYNIADWIEEAARKVGR